MTTGGYYVPVVTTGRFSDAPGSIYRSILSSCRYYLEDFDYRSILVDSGSIVHCADGPASPEGDDILQAVLVLDGQLAKKMKFC